MRGGVGGEMGRWPGKRNANTHTLLRNRRYMHTGGTVLMLTHTHTHINAITQARCAPDEREPRVCVCVCVCVR